MTKASVTGQAAGKKHLPVTLGMRDTTTFRPLICTLADALHQIEQKKLKSIVFLRGRTSGLRDWGTSIGATTWIEGETETERFEVGIPISRWFSGIDGTGHQHEFPITKFNWAEITMDGLLRLEGNVRITQVEFTIPPLTFVLTDIQKAIAKLVSEFLNLTAHDFPTGYLDYAGTGQVKLGALKPVADFVRSRWQERFDTPPPSSETIATTLEALFMRPRKRN